MPLTRTRRRGATVIAILAVLALGAAPAAADELPANPGNFRAVFSSAQPGDVVVLAAGDYGTFTGAMKPGVVAIRPAPGATAEMRIQFRGASNISVEGLTLRGIELSRSSTRNITVRNSTITGQTVMRTGELQNANILFDRNVHGSWDKCNGCGEGRVWLPQRTSQPSGITIQNSRFGPGGDSDGIQNGSNGTRILNNEFVGIRQVENGAAHADAIQLYGSSNTVVRGNWFHGVSVGIMAPDGAEHEIIEDNVIQSTSPYAIQLGSDAARRPLRVQQALRDHLPRRQERQSRVTWHGDQGQHPLRDQLAGDGTPGGGLQSLRRPARARPERHAGAAHVRRR
jgi:Right handed beta helix region